MEQKNLVQLIIEDNGCGIPENIIDKIFDSFFTTKEQGEGTGLGLPIAYEIIQDHDGDIRVESEPGSWTRFTISLPIIPNNKEGKTGTDKGQADV